MPAMQLFVLRHGNAELFAASDSERELTPKGVSETRSILSACGSLERVTKIIASPYVRAQQTAKLVSNQLDLPVETSELLVPEARIETVVAWLEGLEGEVPLLVSHQPFVGRFVDWLADLDPGRYVMGTSALAELNVDVLARGCADLVSLKQP